MDTLADKQGAPSSVTYFQYLLTYMETIQDVAILIAYVASAEQNDTSYGVQFLKDTMKMAITKTATTGGGREYANTKLWKTIQAKVDLENTKPQGNLVLQ
eukprot:3934579-Rhodomonas_salina.1